MGFGRARRAAHEVDSRGMGVLGELLEGAFADAAGGAEEEGGEVVGAGRRGVGGGGGGKVVREGLARGSEVDHSGRLRGDEGRVSGGFCLG